MHQMLHLLARDQDPFCQMFFDVQMTSPLYGISKAQPSLLVANHLWDPC